MGKNNINYKTRKYVWEHPLINVGEFERFHKAFANGLITHDEYCAFFEDLRWILIKFDTLKSGVAERFYK